MTTTGAGNIHALAIEGTFDDCQAIVKGLFNNHTVSATRSRCRVSTRSTGRGSSPKWFIILRQRLRSARRCGRWISRCRPEISGDIFAGLVAKRMGLPVRWLRIASNVNDILPRTLKTGIY